MQIMNQSKRTTLGPTLACYTRLLLTLDLKTPQNKLPNNPRVYAQQNSARQTVDVAVIPGGLTSVLQPLDKSINKPFKAKLRMLHEIWMVNGPFTYTPSGKKRAPSKELVLTCIDRAWNGIPQDLIEKSFKSCGIANALDGSEDDVVWEEENEETEDAEEIIDNEFETVSEGKEGE